MKNTCECGKEIIDVYNPADNFEYIGCDEKNNPYFKCKDCGSLVRG